MAILDQSYSELTAKTRIDRAVWSRWFNRKQEPTIKTLEQVAKDLKVPADELIREFRAKRDRVLAQKKSRTKPADRSQRHDEQPGPDSAIPLSAE